MRRKKRIIAVLMATAVAVSGCGHSGTEVVKKENSTVITVLAGQSTSDAGVEEMIDAALAEKFPNIKLDWECVDWGENFDSAVRARFASGDIPDIMVGKAQDVLPYVSTGNLAPMDEELTKEISEEALKIVSVDGTAYGMPYNAAYQGVIYNKDIFNRLGLSIPHTDEELAEIITSLQNAGVTPFASHFMENWSIANMTMQHMVNGVFAENENWGNMFRNYMTGFNSDERVRACYKKNQTIFDNTWDDALYIDQYESDKRFEQGEAAMYLTGTWSVQFVDSTETKYGIFPYPNETGDAKLIRETNMTFMKSADTAYSDEVDEILQYILSDEKLMAEILEFTQTSTILKSGIPENRTCLKDDIHTYNEKDMVTEAGIGNTQLLWTYQYNIAMEQQQWLQGKESLEDVLTYADNHRKESSY